MEEQNQDDPSDDHQKLEENEDQAIMNILMDNYVCSEQTDQLFIIKNYEFTEHNLELELAFDLYGIPNMWEPPMKISAKLQEIKENFRNNSDHNPVQGTLLEVLDAHKMMITDMSFFDEHLKLVAFAMQKLQPFLLDMHYKELNSRNIDYESAERDYNSAVTQIQAEIAEKWMEHQKLFYMDIFTELNKMENHTMTDMNKPVTDKINDEESEICKARNEANCETNKLICKSEKMPSEAIGISYERNGREIFERKKFRTKMLRIICTRKNDTNFELNNHSNESNRRVKKEEEDDDEKITKLNSQKQTRRQNALKDVVNCLIRSSNLVQTFNNSTLKDVRKLISEAQELEKFIDGVKPDQVVTLEELKCSKKAFHAYVGFANQIRKCISDLTKSVSLIEKFVNYNEDELFATPNDSIFHDLAYLEEKFKESFLLFRHVLVTSETILQFLYQLVHFDNSTGFFKQQSTSSEPSLPIINYFLNFRNLLEILRGACENSGTYADLLHCLLTLLNDCKKKSDINLLQEANCRDANKVAADEQCKPSRSSQHQGSNNTITQQATASCSKEFSAKSGKVACGRNGNKPSTSYHPSTTRRQQIPSLPSRRFNAKTHKLADQLIVASQSKSYINYSGQNDITISEQLRQQQFAATATSTTSDQAEVYIRTSEGMDEVIFFRILDFDSESESKSDNGSASTFLLQTILSSSDECNAETSAQNLVQERTAATSVQLSNADVRRIKRKSKRRRRR